MDYGWIRDAGVAGAMALVVFMFLKHIKEITKGFLDTIRNHIDHNNEAIEENTKVLGGVDKTLSRLTGFLERNGRG